MEDAEKIIYEDFNFKEDMLKIKVNVNGLYEAVIAPYRGGLTMGTKLSHILGIPLGVLNYQRIDSKYNDKKINFAIDPNDEYIFMKKVLLVDDICDTGQSIEKLYKFLKLYNPECQIDIICIYGNKNSESYLTEKLGKINYKYLRDNEDKWVTFGTWEDDYNKCKHCAFGEPCYNNPDIETHCHIENKSGPNEKVCEHFKLPEFRDFWI